jgi:hypothetical protein
VRDLPEQIYRKLQNNAKKDHRSLSQQAIESAVTLPDEFVSEKELNKRLGISEGILSG